MFDLISTFIFNPALLNKLLAGSLIRLFGGKTDNCLAINLGLKEKPLEEYWFQVFDKILLVVSSISKKEKLKENVN